MVNAPLKTVGTVLRRYFLEIFVFALVLLLSVFALDIYPNPWWDEGWTLVIAKNWVEMGHYGRILAGEPVSPGLSASFFLIAPIAASFELFGVGLLQARIVVVFFLIGSLAIQYYLAHYIFNRKVAVGTLAVVLIMSRHPGIHPIYTGRQVLADMPMLFFLLVGFVFLNWSLEKSSAWLVLAVLAWGICLRIKLQPLPFWVLSLSMAVVLTLYRRRYYASSIWAIGLAGGYMSARLLQLLQQNISAGQSFYVAPLEGVFRTTAFVPGHLHNRLFALRMVLIVGLPALLGLFYVTRRRWKWVQQYPSRPNDDRQLTQMALVFLAGSWFAWYLGFSNGGVRYMLPAVFIGSMFAAKMLYDLTDGYDVKGTIYRTALAVKRRRLDRRSAGAFLVIILVAATVPATIATVQYSFFDDIQETYATQATVEYLNEQIPADALIETYDSELFFFTDHTYHYPPDQVHVTLNRRTLLREDVPIEYDPLAADPDYLIVGEFSRLWHLYDAVLRTDAFRLVKVIGEGQEAKYEIYKRVR